MRCEACQGTGWRTVLRTVPRGVLPCEACNGFGVQHCCEGVQPDMLQLAREVVQALASQPLVNVQAWAKQLTGDCIHAGEAERGALREQTQLEALVQSVTTTPCHHCRLQVATVFAVDPYAEGTWPEDGPYTPLPWCAGCYRDAIEDI